MDIVYKHSPPLLVENQVAFERHTAQKTDLKLESHPTEDLMSL